MRFGDGLGIGWRGRSDRRPTPEAHRTEMGLMACPHWQPLVVCVPEQILAALQPVAVLGRRPSRDRDQSSLKTMWSQ